MVYSLLTSLYCFFGRVSFRRKPPSEEKEGRFFFRIRSRNMHRLLSKQGSRRGSLSPSNKLKTTLILQASLKHTNPHTAHQSNHLFIGVRE